MRIKIIQKNTKFCEFEEKLKLNLKTTMQVFKSKNSSSKGTATPTSNGFDKIYFSK